MQVLLLERDGALHVMTGIRLMKRGGFQARAALLRRLVRVDHVLAWLASRGRRDRLTARRGLLEKWRIGLDDDRRTGNVAEPLGQLAFGARDRGLGELDQIFAALEAVRRIRLC